MTEILVTWKDPIAVVDERSHTALERSDDRWSTLSCDTDKPNVQSFAINSFLLVLTCINTPKHKGKGVS